MQEDLLFFFRSLDSIKFVGEKFLAGLTRLLPGVKFKDILFHFPVDVIDRTYSPLIKDAISGRIYFSKSCEVIPAVVFSSSAA